MRHPPDCIGFTTRNERVGVFIDHLGLCSPLGFVLSKPLISRVDRPKVVAAQALFTGILDRVPMEQIIGSQGLILPSPPCHEIRHRLLPLQKQKTSEESAVSCLDLFSQQQLEPPLWLQALPGQFKHAVWLW